jgi:stage V sporulation protein AD
MSTVFFKRGAYIFETASVCGEIEKEGPLGKWFDKTLSDDLLGQKSYELAESEMHRANIQYLLNKCNIKSDAVDAVFAGDLTDEIYGTNFAMRSLNTGFFGIYNACATFGESLTLAAMSVDGGYFNPVIASVSSHFCTAERQFRFPLELGNQKTPLSQRTVTASGAVLITNRKCLVKIDCATIGRVTDYGIKDAADMGAAMAPAAFPYRMASSTFLPSARA